MPVTLRYSAALDTTYSSAMDDDDDVMSSTSQSRSRTSLAGSSDSLDLLVSGSGTGTPSGSGSGHSRQTSADSGADSRNSASPSADHPREPKDPKDVVIASSAARGLKSNTKPAHNPLQFVKTGVCPLYKKAAEQMKKAEEVRKVRQMTREQEEEWQSNLDNWKSKRRQIGQKSLDQALDDRQQQMEDRHRRQQQRKSKTFSEMMEERTRRSTTSKVVIYHDDDDWNRSPPEPQSNGNGNATDNLMDTESAASPTSRLLDTSFDSSLSDHVFDDLKGDLASESEQVVPKSTAAEECTFENAIRSYAQYAESRTSRGSSVTSASQGSSSFSSCSNSSHAAPSLGHRDQDDSVGRESPSVQHQRLEMGDQVTLLVVLKRGEPRDFGFGTKSGRENWGNVLVESVQPNGPADMAGLRVNDEVLSINGESTSNRSHSAIVFAIKQAVYTGSLELRVHRTREPGHAAADVSAEQDADPGSDTPRSGSVMKRRSLFERATSPGEDSSRERESLSRNLRSLDVAESLKERLASFESPEPRDRPHSWNDPLEDIRTDSSFQQKLRSFQIMNSTDNVVERRRVSATGHSKPKTDKAERDREPENDKKRQFERTQSCGFLNVTGRKAEEEVGGQDEGQGDHTVPLVESEVRVDTASPSSGFELAETLQETAIVGSRPTSPDTSRQKLADVASLPVPELDISISRKEQVLLETTAASNENQNFELDGNYSLNDREEPIVLDDDEYLAPVKQAEPPKEKPPPPPIDLDYKADPLPNGEELPVSIRKDIWRRRSNFLGTKASEVEDFIEREIRHVSSPPDMESLLKAERQQEESSRRERNSSSSRSWDGTELSFAAHQEALYENVPLRQHRQDNESNCDDDEIARKEQEIIENLEREERQRGDDGKVVRTTNGNEACSGRVATEDRDTWEEALKLKAKEEELRRQEELLRLEKEKLRQEQEMLMRQKEAYKQQIEQHRQMMPSSSVPLRSEISTRPKSAPPPPPPVKPRSNHVSTPNHMPSCSPQHSPPIPSSSHMVKDHGSMAASTSSTPNYYDEPRALTMPVSVSHSPGQPSWSASSSSSASLSMSSSTASSGLSAHSLSASPKAKLTEDDRWKVRKMPPEDSNMNHQRHWVVQEAEMRRIAEQNERTMDDDRGYSVPQPLGPKMGQPTNSTRDSDYSYAYGIHAPAVRYTPAVGPQPRSEIPGRAMELEQQQQHHQNHNVQQVVPPLPAPRRPLPSTPIAQEQSPVQSQTVTNGNGIGNSHHRDPQMLSVSGKKKCSHCKEELGRGAAMVIESLELFYHIHCFQCCVCHVQLGNGLSGADVRVRNHKLHCHNCYSSDDGLKFSKV